MVNDGYETQTAQSKVMISPTCTTAGLPSLVRLVVCCLPRRDSSGCDEQLVRPQAPQRPGCPESSVSSEGLAP